MSEYIKRQDALDALRAMPERTPADRIREIPAEDVAPVVHGTWGMEIDTGCEMHVCSVCGCRVIKQRYEYRNPNLYCYHCGAKMDGGYDGVV